jgi:5S rRNA maturation endonuclease (ribonuclease M5)
MRRDVPEVLGQRGGAMTTAPERLIDALAAAGMKVKPGRRPQTASAQCPAHDDHTPSLSITGVEGKALIYCHAGCDKLDILAALGLSLADLFDDPGGETYRYDNGRTVRRTPDKRFWQNGTDRPPELYRLANVRRAVAAGQTIYVVEGEKDVHALESLGAVATTAPMGAGQWSKIDPTPLHGGRVVVVADLDEPGENHARDVAASLAGRAHVTLAAPKAGKDAADHVAAGYGVDDLILTPPPDDAAADDGAPFFDVVRADSVIIRRVVYHWAGRIPLGAVTLMPGEEGIGKTTVGIRVLADTTRGSLEGEHHGVPRNVVVLATEDGLEDVFVPRLREAGAVVDDLLVTVGIGREVAVHRGHPARR